MAFSETFLEELAARNEIADVVGAYVRLTKRSGSNQFGLCPFHSEKTPSFSVSSDKQMFYCFGCNKGGGVLHFIMEIEGLTFPDAVHFLARRAGMQVPEEDGADAKTAKRRERLLHANRDAARLFHSLLKSPAGKAAAQYLQARGMSPAMVTQFGIGAAADAWSTLLDALTKKGYTQEELIAAGLARHGKNGGAYDAFRNRLQFPIIDVRGNVLGFSGRMLGDGEPKYLNTPDTPVFNKSRNLFGLHLAKKSRAGYFLLVEGNMDVVSLHQAGFDSAVAPLGTALTEMQARLMLRYKNEVVIAFDADSAGVRAAERAIGILEQTGIAVKVLRMAGAKDPDEFIKLHGRGAFSNLIEARETQIEYRLLSLRQKHSLEQDAGRVAYLQEAEKLLATLRSEVEIEVYAGRVAELSGVSAESIRRGIARQRKLRQKDRRRSFEREGMRPARAMQPAARDLRYENTASAVAEEGILRLLLRDPALYAPNLPLVQSDFSSKFLGRVYVILCERLQAGRENTIATLAPLFDSQEMSRIAKLLEQPENLADGKQALEDYIEKIKAEALRRRPAANEQEFLQNIVATHRKLKGVESTDG